VDGKKKVNNRKLRIIEGKNEEWKIMIKSGNKSG